MILINVAAAKEMAPLGIMGTLILLAWGGAIFILGREREWTWHRRALKRKADELQAAGHCQAKEEASKPEAHLAPDLQ